MSKAIKFIALGLVSSLLIASCGSGSGSGSNADLTWIAGVFRDASQYKNYCEVPRRNSPYMSGSTLHELHWLRSWSNNTYLWYDEILDQDLTKFDNPVKYFKTLRTNAVTRSGKPRDRFHYAENTEDHKKLVSGSANASYGAHFKWIRTLPPRSLKITYVELNSPAAKAGLSRGAEIISVDGVDVGYGSGSDVKTLIWGLYPKSNFESHTFLVRDASGSHKIRLTSQVVKTTPVRNLRVINAGDERVGYFTFNTFATVTAEAALKNAFEELSQKGINDLIIDLRYNGGGYLAISAQLGYMIAGAQSENYTFEKMVFNNKHPYINPVTGKKIVARPFISKGVGFSVDYGQKLPTVSLNRVFILTSARTCSASEALINGLRGIDVKVILIGKTTCGKPYGFYSTDNCGITYSTIQLRGENAKGFGDYADGFSPNNTFGYGVSVPGCNVEDDFSHSLGDENEAMLKAALNYRLNGRCPTNYSTSVNQVRSLDNMGDEDDDLRNDQLFIDREIKNQIRLDALRFGL